MLQLLKTTNWIFKNFILYTIKVTRGIKPSFGAVRNIYTPSQGHKVFGLDQIENNMTLVAGGIERFRSIG